MSDKHMNIGAIGYGNPGLVLGYAMYLLQMVEQEKRRINALPPDEQERIKREQVIREQYLEAAREQRRIEFSVHQGKCPDCGSKLTRGKKDKRNEYKRPWSCSCGKVFYL